MRTIAQLQLDDCRHIAGASEAMAQQQHAQVSIALCDGGGHLLLVQRLDGASAASMEVAIAKARMAALNGKATADQEAAINGQRPALLQLAGVLGQPAVAMAGGLPLQVEGQCIGAIGVSGMTPELDGAIAAAGAAVLPTLIP